MQPYFLPYLGYWQLIHRVEALVFLDHVSSGGNAWVRRNRVFDASGNPVWLTLHLESFSQFTPIGGQKLLAGERWRKSMSRQIRRIPKRHSDHLPIVELLEKHLAESSSLVELSTALIEQVSQLLELDTRFLRSSEVVEDSQLTGEDLILDICRRLRADSYFNPPGGKGLYRASRFKEHGVKLEFLPEPPHALVNSPTHMSVVQDLALLGLRDFCTLVEQE